MFAGLLKGTTMEAIEPDEMSFKQIYDMVVENGELILKINKEDEAALRKGLASVKYRQNAKLKDSGLEPDTSVLSYQVTSLANEPGKISIQILLSTRTSIKVHNISLPDPEF